MNKLLSTLNVLALFAVTCILYDIIRNPPEIEITITTDKPMPQSSDYGYAFVNNGYTNGTG